MRNEVENAIDNANYRVLHQVGGLWNEQLVILSISRRLRRAGIIKEGWLVKKIAKRMKGTHFWDPYYVPGWFVYTFDPICSSTF